MRRLIVTAKHKNDAPGRLRRRCVVVDTRPNLGRQAYTLIVALRMAMMR
ncbi:MAG: hypothetical protein ACREJU_07195 [Nitrospiraceae bacterium]